MRALKTKHLANRRNIKMPIIADFQMSKTFGTSWQSRKCPTITKARAGGRAFWLVDQVDFGPGTDEHGFVKRRLDASDYATLQGWDKVGQQKYLGIRSWANDEDDVQKNPELSKGQLLGALGNSFSITVVAAIMENLLQC